MHLRVILISLVAALFSHCPAVFGQVLPCGRFTEDRLGAPEPRETAPAVARFDRIKYAVGTEPYRALFLGDALTERFDPKVWQQHLAARSVLNAGVNGDRTEHLLWRLIHGNLAGPLRPSLVIVLIGTDDLGHGRPPEQAAEGIRANLLYLRVLHALDEPSLRKLRSEIIRPAHLRKRSISI